MPFTRVVVTRHLVRLAWAPLALALGACSLLPAKPEGTPRKQHALAVTGDNQLLRFNAGQPGHVLSRRALTGLLPGDTLRGIDFRIARGQLFGLGTSGQLYRIDPETGASTPVGSPIGIALTGDEIGFDFNPTVDRIRVVTHRGQNLRLHPDTGAVVDGNPAVDGVQTDGTLAYAADDLRAGQLTEVVAAAYTYNKTNEKITTNYAIDANFGALVMQGSKEGVQPVVSPNTGILRTVGSLNTAPFKRASFDIDDTTNTAYAALSGAAGTQARWVEIDLATGNTTALGIIGKGQAVRGIAIEP